MTKKTANDLFSAYDHLTLKKRWLCIITLCKSYPNCPKLRNMKYRFIRLLGKSDSDIALLKTRMKHLMSTKDLEMWDRLLTAKAEKKGYYRV